MKLVICAIFDKKSNEYQQPFVAPNTTVALRNFQQACKDEKSFLNQYPDDFRLDYLGYFETETGKLISLGQQETLCEAKNLVIKSA